MTDLDFKLPVCRKCGNTMYPPRERCSECLSDEVSLQAVDNSAVILATTELHSTLEPYFSEKLPGYMAVVKLHAGPVAIVDGARELEVGASVRLAFRPHWKGEGIALLSVRQETKAPT